MKRICKPLLVFTSLTALTTTAFAQQTAYAPELEGGVTFTVGTFYAAPSSDTVPYAQTLQSGTPPNYHYPSTDYDWGFEASLGYVFEDTANGIELSYRGLDADSDSSVTGDFNKGIYVTPPGFTTQTDEAFNTLTNKFNSVDLMISQFLDIGEAMQMRFQAGLAYIDLEQDNNTNFMLTTEEDLLYPQLSHSEYQGLGPRLGIDARYDFGDDLAGFGIVAGGSLAYFFGELDSSSSLNAYFAGELLEPFYNIQDNTDNHSVLNLRGNIGIDYVYFFDDEESTLGIEFGYLVDYYDDAVSQISTSNFDVAVDYFDSDVVAVSFMGPYINLKGVF